jgi:hypothetical protein
MVTPIFKPSEVSDKTDVEHSLSAAAVLADHGLAWESAVLVYRRILTMDEKHKLRCRPQSTLTRAGQTALEPVLLTAQ